MRAFQEKRKHRRIEVATHATFKPLVAMIPLNFSCRTVDISEGGVKLVISRWARPLKLVRLKFWLEGYDHKFDIWAKTVWSKVRNKDKGIAEAGLRFSELTKKENSILNDFISKQS